MRNWLVNQWLGVKWWVTCGLGRHTKYPIVRSVQDHTVIYHWCYKCNRKWPA